MSKTIYILAQERRKCLVERDELVLKSPVENVRSFCEAAGDMLGVCELRSVVFGMRPGADLLLNPPNTADVAEMPSSVRDVDALDFAQSLHVPDVPPTRHPRSSPGVIREAIHEVVGKRLL